MYKVRINNIIYDAYEGELLAYFLRKAGKDIPIPCGGNGKCGKCIVTVNGAKERACEYIIKSDIELTLPDNEEIISDKYCEKDSSVKEDYILALDIGTTTLALTCISEKDKKITSTFTVVNPQRSFGADIMSRIAYCMNNGPEELQKSIIDAVNKLIEKAGIINAVYLYVSGNTTMLHLFFGVDCSSLGYAPYTPVFLDSKMVSGESLGISKVKKVISLPCIAAFVGADITAGMNYIGLPENNKYNILIDLGTNAEIVIFSNDKAVCTSAAAGPCFEGANISCGMSASCGAIYSYSENGYRTINDAPAIGICGTGLIDVIATLLKKRIIDKTGYMECGCYSLAPGVKLTQDDVRQYQLAKSAVYSALGTLLITENIDYNDIENLYISGGFSSKINTDNAVFTGLIPKELKDKCVSIGNSSLLGTAKYAIEKNDLSVFLDNAEYIDLAESPVFSDCFIKNMKFNN